MHLGINNIHSQLILCSMLHLKFPTVCIKGKTNGRERFQQVSTVYKSKHDIMKSVGDTDIFPLIFIPCLSFHGNRMSGSADGHLDY